MKAILLLLIPLILGTNEKVQQEEKDKDKEKESSGIMKHEDVSTRKKYKLAKYLDKNGSYYNAVEYFASVYPDKENNSRVVAKLAELNLALRDYPQAEEWYGKLVEMKDPNFPLARLRYAQMLQVNGKCDEAKTEFSGFSSDYDGEDKSKFKALAKAGEEGCDFIKETMENPTNAKVEHLEGDVNHALTDFAPKPMGKGKLMYSSLKSDTAIRINDNEEDYFAKIFTGELEDDSWGNSRSLPVPVNDPSVHVGNGVLSEDGNTLYFTRCKENKTLGMDCKIYKSEKFFIILIY